MRIGGIQRLTLSDFPGKVAAIVFTQGCNFRCGYCHNPELVFTQQFTPAQGGREVLEYLRGRCGRLEGVVVSGGEPTLQLGLGGFLEELKNMGFQVKLDTNGSHPEVLSFLFKHKLLDYIAMDVKTSLGKYDKVAGPGFDVQKILKSIRVILQSGIPYQFRTTLIRSLCAPDDVAAISQLLKDAEHYVLQPFVGGPKMIDPTLKGLPHYTSLEIEELKSRFEKPFLRGNT